MPDEDLVIFPYCFDSNEHRRPDWDIGIDLYVCDVGRHFTRVWDWQVELLIHNEINTATTQAGQFSTAKH